jgi:general secretion pathway protein L
LFGKPGDPASVLQVGDGELALLLADRRRPNPIVVPLTGYGDHERRLRIQAVLRSHRASSAVTVRLDRSLVFETAIELPLSAEGSLAAILRHQIERLVPLPSAEASFAWRVASRSAFANTLKVDLVIARTATINRALATAAAGGLDPRLVAAPEPQSSSHPAAEPMALWQAGRGRGETPALRRLRHGIEIAAIVLVLAAYGLHVHRLDQIRTDLQAQIGRERPVAAAVQSLAQQVERAGAELAFFRGRRQDPSPLAVLDALTRLMPTDSWVKELSVHGRTIEISGFSPHAADLVARIESSATFENPQFRSPITLAPDGKSERFDLSLDAKRGSKP